MFKRDANLIGVSLYYALIAIVLLLKFSEDSMPFQNTIF